MTNLLARKAVLANFTMSFWGAKKHDKETTGEVLKSKGAERHTGIFTKKLLNKASMKELRRIKNASHQYHKAHTQPWLVDGTRILPTALYMDYAEQMRKYREEFDKAVNAFVTEYPSYIKTAKKELGRLFNDKDYPPVDQIGTKFGFEVAIDNVPDKDDFRVDISKDALDQIKKEMEERITRQMREAVKDAATRLLEVVQHMASSLGDYKPKDKKTGKRAEGIFKDSLVDNVKEIASLLPAFNLGDDPKLINIHKRVVKELCAAEADALRDDTNVRKRVKTSADQISKMVSEFLA